MNATRFDVKSASKRLLLSKHEQEQMQQDYQQVLDAVHTALSQLQDNQNYARFTCPLCDKQTGKLEIKWSRSGRRMIYARCADGCFHIMT